MVKKSVSVILTAIMILSVFTVLPITANAEVTKSGIVGDCEYEYDSATGGLRVFGGTFIDKDSDGHYPWAADSTTFNTSIIKSVTIADGIKAIGNGAFYYCQNLKTITMPNDLTYIGKSSFSNCTALKTIKLPFYLKTIELAAFSGCTALESVSFSTHIETIGNEAFSGCTNLAEAAINDGAKAEIGNYAFCNTALADVFIPAGTIKIGTYAFGYDKGYSPVSAFTIYTTEGSAGETYAKNKDHITVEYIKPIETVDFTDIVEPVIGENPNFTYNTSSEGFTVKNAKPVWTNESDGDTLSSTKTFKALKEYSVAFTLNAKKGYKFAVDESRNSTVTGTINGKEAKINAAEQTPEDEIIVYIAFPKLFDPDNPVVIDNVNLTLNNQPVAGEKPDTTVHVHGEGYSMYSMYWYNFTDKKKMNSADVFEPSKEYKAYIFLSADEYHKFSVVNNMIQVSATVDSEAANTYGVTGKAYDKYITIVSNAYKTGELELSSVAFNNVTLPVSGKEADFTFTSSKGFTVENDEINWWNDTDKCDMAEGDKFEKGKSYIAFFSITAENGYNFSVDKDGFTTVTAAVNGKSAYVQALSGKDPVKQLRVYARYTAVDEPVETEPEPPTEEPPTEEPPTEEPPTEGYYETEPEPPTQAPPTEPFETEPEPPTQAPPTEPFETEPEPPTEAPPTEPYETEPVETDSETQPQSETAEPQPSVINISYLPSDEQELKGYNYSLFLKDKDGNTERYPMISAGEKINGKYIYTAELSADIELDELYVQVYDGETWISQIELNSSSAVNGAVFDFEGKPIENEPENPTDPVVTDPQPTVPETTAPSVKPVVKKKANPIKVTVKKKTVKLKKLRKKAQKVKAVTVKNSVGKLSFKLVKSGITKKIRKYVKINSKGVITLKKWKEAKKGTYKIKVKITAKGNASYNAKTLTKTVKVKIK